MRTFFALLIALAWWLFLSTPMLGQQQFVQPDPNNGRPLLVLSMDAMRWEVPIQVYSDKDSDFFTTKDSLIASAHSFNKDGKYFVLLYEHYEDDYICKRAFTAEQKARIPDFASNCQLMAYGLYWLEVDTQKKLFKIPRSLNLTPDGRFDSFNQPISWLQIDTSPVRLKTAIATITERLRKEVQQEKLMGKF